jgi:hypothetical protein
MASEKQVAANKLNAQKSTGPKTAEGKAIAATNSFKHGIWASASFISEEDSTLLQALQTKIYEHYCPSGGKEEVLVDRIVGYLWRLRRVFQVEAWCLKPDNYLDHLLHNMSPAEKAVERTLANRFVSHASYLLTLSRYEQSIERMLTKATKELEEMQARRAGHQLPVIDAQIKR